MEYFLARTSAAAAAATLAFACGGYSSTPRVVDGQQITDRPISPAAYAAYANAARLEALGELELALAAYREALGHDGESADIQTRIATLVCQLTPDVANEEFEEAAELDENYETLWRNWSACELRRGKLNRSERMARRGLQSAPDSLEATLMLARVIEAGERPKEAVQVLVAYVVRFPSDRAAWRELYFTAQRQQNAAWLREASLELSTPSALTAEPSPPLGSERELVVRALLDQGLPAARDAAVEAGLSPTELGWIALSHAESDAALAQAILVLSADPENTEAAILGLVASYRSSRAAEFGMWLTRMPADARMTDLDEQAREALVRVVRDRVGESAASALEQRLELLPIAGQAAPAATHLEESGEADSAPEAAGSAAPEAAGSGAGSVGAASDAE